MEGAALTQDFDVALARLLRIGVSTSIVVVVIGMIITFVHHPDYVSSMPALGTLTTVDQHFPSSIGDVIEGLRAGRGQAVIMAGLLILIATPVARVAFSIVIFLVQRDWLYVAITSTVLILLIVSFFLGAPHQPIRTVSIDTLPPSMPSTGNVTTSSFRCNPRT